MYFTRPFINKLFRIGLLFTIILVLLDILTFFFYPDSTIGKIFLATREQTPLTWVSSVLLLLIALSCATAYTKTNDKLWFALSVLFIFFSIDDAIYFHERFSGAVQEVISIIGVFPSYSWVVLYMPLLVFSLVSIVYLLWQASSGSRKKKKMLFVAVLIFGFSLLLDMIDGWVENSDTLVFCIDLECSLNMAHIFRLMEEVLEVIGLGIIAYITIITNSVTGDIDI